MAHPRMYDDDDPFLAELRKICLALPEATEKESWGRPTFRAGKIFAMFAGDEEHPDTVIFKPDDDERVALVQDSRFYSPPYWGSSGWLSLDFSAAPVDWSEVAELVETSYRQIALKRMVAALDANPR
jgi:predicted DNA-binding protein (MmcQ/YjbR family)